MLYMADITVEPFRTEGAGYMVIQTERFHCTHTMYTYYMMYTSIVIISCLYLTDRHDALDIVGPAQDYRLPPATTRLPLSNYPC